MKVHLAGFNVDTQVLRELQEKAGIRQDITPEVISAAYARISRDPRPIDQIRKDARREVERSRKSNRTVIFKMGHHSVAEHAVFNLDILGVSRLAMEEVEKFRLCSYTEKSQRYITLDKGFVLPDEIKGTGFEKRFIGLVGEQNEAYALFFKELRSYLFKKYADLASNPKNESLLEGRAKEDARYITALATEAQAGETINARNLELLLRRFASHPLKEVRKLGRTIYGEVAPVAPSIIIFHQANERDKKTYPELKDLAKELIGGKRQGRILKNARDVELSEFTPDGDLTVAAALLHASSDLPYAACKDVVKNMSPEETKKIFKVSCRNLQFYDSLLREFEYVNLTFNIVLSAACFAQLKRHRMATITVQNYDPGLGVTLPESIKEIGREGEFRRVIDKTNELYYAIEKENPLAAPYILTNAHRRRILIRMNPRELYHISRLREDSHAQWEINRLAKKISQRAKEVMPQIFATVGGKDRYNAIYEEVYGRPPKVTEMILPGARKIADK